MGLALAVVLVVFTGAHFGLAVGIARRRPGRGGAARRLGVLLVALLVPPLTPWWGWRAGLRARTIAWGAALALYAAGVLGVAVTGR